MGCNYYLYVGPFLKITGFAAKGKRQVKGCCKCHKEMTSNFCPTHGIETGIIYLRYDKSLSNLLEELNLSNDFYELDPENYREYNDKYLLENKNSGKDLKYGSIVKKIDTSKIQSSTNSFKEKYKTQIDLLSNFCTNVEVCFGAIGRVSC